MADSVIKSYFPSQVVSDIEKVSYDYGMKVAKAIESASGFLMATTTDT